MEFQDFTRSYAIACSPILPSRPLPIKINTVHFANQRPIFHLVPDSTPALRRLIFLFAKLAILLAVLLAVAHTFRDAWGQLGQQSWSVEPLWLLLAGLLYVLALAPMALYWSGLLSALSHPPGLLDAFRGYLLGHLTKYVPGKALTLVVRAAAVRREGTPAAPIVATVFIETLTLMAVGAALSALLLPRELQERIANPFVTALFALVALLPAVPPVTKRILGVVLRRQIEEASRDRPLLFVYSWQLFIAGVVAALISWVFMGWSVWATVRAIGVLDVAPIGNLDLWVVAAALPVVAGFLSMIPGGLIVRDGLMILLLKTQLEEPAAALVVTALIRVIWLVSECLACGILEVATRMRTKQESIER